MEHAQSLASLVVKLHGGQAAKHGVLVEKYVRAAVAIGLVNHQVHPSSPPLNQVVLLVMLTVWQQQHRPGHLEQLQR